MLNLNNEPIRQAIAACLPTFANLFKKESEEMMKTFKTHLLTKEDLPQLRGAAYAISGIIKGLGVKVIEDGDLIKEINDICFHKKNSKPHNKIAGLYFYETMSITLGKSFELFLERVIDNILS